VEALYKYPDEGVKLCAKALENSEAAIDQSFLCLGGGMPVAGIKVLLLVRKRYSGDKRTEENVGHAGEKTGLNQTGTQLFPSKAGPQDLL
jgi:hypothetical protein